MSTEPISTPALRAAASTRFISGDAGNFIAPPCQKPAQIGQGAALAALVGLVLERAERADSRCDNSSCFGLVFVLS
jgi:hypothetical protein